MGLVEVLHGGGGRPALLAVVCADGGSDHGSLPTTIFGTLTKTFSPTRAVTASSGT
jgi:hypothetical protein